MHPKTVNCIFWNFLFFALVFGQDNDLDFDSSTDSAKLCPDYRQLARVPNPLSNRGDVCCEDLGCFSNEKGTIWEHLSETPWCLAKIKTGFDLYTPENGGESPMSFDYFNFNETLAKGALKLSKNRPFFAVVHGFNTKWPSQWMLVVKNELLKLGNNVLLVNWTPGSNTKNYVTAAANTRVVGKALAKIMKTLIDRNLIDLNTATIVGFSLGAHTAGYVGHELQGLKRIIGLDPAGPLFVCESRDARLDPSDAKFVQIIHSNGQSILSGGLGTMQIFGHVDFYANDGRVQPGCPATTTTSVLYNFATFSFAKVGNSVSCSHARCPWLFIDMLKQASGSLACKYTSFPCTDSVSWTSGSCFSCPQSTGCPTPGYNLDFGSSVRGKYFFNTHEDNSTGSFCGTQFFLKLETDKNVKGSIDVTFYGSDNKELWSEKFQKSDDSISETKSVGLVAPFNVRLESVDKMLILYKKYESIFTKDGPTKFTLNKITLTDWNNVKMTSCQDATVINDEIQHVKLQKSC